MNPVTTIFLTTAVVMTSGSLPSRPAVPKPPPTAEQRAVRAVVRAVTEKAAALKGKGRTGDELTAEYVRAAATASAGLDKTVRVRAFLVGLGLALDDSTVLRDKPGFKTLALAAESDAERAERLTVLGSPTVQGRRDLCQHFAVSAALAEVLGGPAAELVGLSKELLDMKGASGFSFADLAADLAGIELAAMIAREPKRLAALADGFDPAEYVPGVKPFREGLTEKQFQARFGTTADGRFQTAMDEVRAAVKALPAHKKK